MLVLCTFLYNSIFFQIMFVFKCTVVLFGACLTYCFRVTVSAFSSLVNPAHEQILLLPTCGCDMFEQINLI